MADFLPGDYSWIHQAMTAIYTRLSDLEKCIPSSAKTLIPENRVATTEEKLLDLLQEEAAEIIQIISKIRRFGMDSYHPDDPDKTSNRILFQREIGDFEAVKKLLSNTIVDDLYVEDHANKKAAYLQKEIESGRFL
jgi:hypothetical protein